LVRLHARKFSSGLQEIKALKVNWWPGKSRMVWTTPPAYQRQTGGASKKPASAITKKACKRLQAGMQDMSVQEKTHKTI
jgi:hypothetical protein